MHQAASDFIARHATDAKIRAFDIGGRETNGHARHLFPNADWTVVDAAPGLGVDVVADGATWQTVTQADVVLCVEVAEHTPVWALIVANCWRMLRYGGTLIFTAAGPGRPVHGVNHDDPLCPGWYRNIEPAELDAVMATVGFFDYEIDVLDDDVRAWGRKRWIAPPTSS